MASKETLLEKIIRVDGKLRDAFTEKYLKVFQK